MIRCCQVRSKLIALERPKKPRQVRVYQIGYVIISFKPPPKQRVAPRQVRVDPIKCVFQETEALTENKGRVINCALNEEAQDPTLGKGRPD